MNWWQMAMVLACGASFQTFLYALIGRIDLGRLYSLAQLTFCIVMTWLAWGL